MAKVYAGTSGWAYPSWKPGFYPQGLGSAKLLSHYGTRLNSVEVNYTFLRLPTEELLAAWIEATPSNFKFAIKAPQMITHFKRLRGASKSLTAEFLFSLRVLKETRKLGPVLFQLPPNFKCDLPLLGGFLAGLPRQVRAAFEFRHDSWFRDEVFSLLHEANVALCLAESDTLETPPVHTAGFSYLRLRKK